MVPRNRYALAGAVVAFLVLANFIYYFCTGWGLITVKVHDVPLSQVIKSIEWQGWVKIYTNIPPDTKVTMYVDHVSLAEAMDTLSADIGGGGRGGEGRQRDGAPGTPGQSGNGTPGTPPPGANVAAGATPPPGAPGDNGPGGNGPGGRGRGGFGGGGGFGRGAQWNLAFFVGSTTEDAKAQIRAFENDSVDDNAKIYSYQTPLQMLLGGEDPVSADPRLQNWPGVKAQPAPIAANTAPANADPSGQQPFGQPPAEPEGPPTSVQGYLRSFAQGADIWIMSPGAWDPPVSSPPPPDSSIISAVKKFVSNSHGAVIEAIVLRAGRGGRGGGGGRGGFFAGGDTGWDDRMRNAINGLPEDARAGATEQLNQEVGFWKDVQTAPQDQRMTMIRQHIEAKIADGAGGPMQRMTPEKRAQRFQRMVANRMAAQGK